MYIYTYNEFKNLIIQVNAYFIIFITTYYRKFLYFTFSSFLLYQTEHGSFIVPDGKSLVLTKYPSKSTPAEISKWNNKTLKASPGVYRYYQILQDITKHIRRQMARVN